MATKEGKALKVRGFLLTDFGAENDFLMKSRWVAGAGDGYTNAYIVDCIYSPELHTYQWIARWYAVPVGIGTSLVQAIEILKEFPDLGEGYVRTGGAMAQADKPRRIAAAQIMATPARVGRWDRVAKILGMNRTEFLKFAADSTCDRVEMQGAAESRAGE